MLYIHFMRYMIGLGFWVLNVKIGPQSAVGRQTLNLKPNPLYYTGPK